MRFGTLSGVEPLAVGFDEGDQALVGVGGGNTPVTHPRIGGVTHFEQLNLFMIHNVLERSSVVQ